MPKNRRLKGISRSWLLDKYLQPYQPQKFVQNSKLLNYCEQKKREGTQMVVLTNLVTESNHIGWSEHKNSYVNWVTVGILALEFSGQSLLCEPVYCLCASRITYLWNDRVFYFLPSEGSTVAPEHKTTEPLIVILLPSYHDSVLSC